MQFYLEFEKPLVELEQKITELREYSTDKVDFSGEIKQAGEKSGKTCVRRFSPT